MSGPTHNKGVLIITGYLHGMYAQNKPLAMNASVTFEQNYGGVDGDSASSTEIFAILSALSNIPIRQDIAVTGSVNQNGDIQPIGGVNQKIEGFFDVCRVRGLTGTQGVIIPHQNIIDLMLRLDVIDAVQKGKFHIYTITTSTRESKFLPAILPVIGKTTECSTRTLFMPLSIKRCRIIHDIGENYSFNGSSATDGRMFFTVFFLPGRTGKTVFNRSDSSEFVFVSFRNFTKLFYLLKHRITRHKFKHQ